MSAHGGPGLREDAGWQPGLLELAGVNLCCISLIQMHTELDWQAPSNNEVGWEAPSYDKQLGWQAPRD